MNTNEELLEKLTKLYLKKQEAKVYLSILKTSEAKTGEICKDTGIASSNIYNILNDLIKKGLISYKIKNNIKYFLPSDPEALNEIIQEKQNQLESERKEVTELIKLLKKQEVVKSPFSNYKYFEGISGVKSMWYEINSNMDSTQIALIYAPKKEGYERMVKFYDTHHELRKKKSIFEKIILPFGEEGLGKKRINKFTTVKFSQITSEAEWGVINDMFFIQYVVGNKPISFLIKDKIFSYAFRQTFNQIWDNLK